MRLIVLFFPMALTATRRSTTTTRSVSTRRSWKGRSSSRGTSTDTLRRGDETRRMCRVRVRSIPCTHHACTVHAATLRNIQDLIKKLLTADLTKRLGNLKAGADDVKKHKWFTACMPPTDFEALLAGKGEAPIKVRRAARAMRTPRRAAPSRPTGTLHPILESIQAPLTSPNPPLEPPHPIHSKHLSPLPQSVRPRTADPSLTRPLPRMATPARGARGRG